LRRAFLFSGACLLGGLKRSKCYMLNRSESHAIGAARSAHLMRNWIRNHSGFAQRIAAMSARAWKGEDCSPPRFVAITREPLLEIQKRRGCAALRALGDRKASAPWENDVATLRPEILRAQLSPARLPRRLAAASPAMTRSHVSARSYCTSAPKIENSNSPWGVVVSISSVSERTVRRPGCTETRCYPTRCPIVGPSGKSSVQGCSRIIVLLKFKLGRRPRLSPCTAP